MKNLSIFFISNYHQSEIKRNIKINDKINFYYFNCNKKRDIYQFEKKINSINKSEKNYLISFSNNYIFKEKIIKKFFFKQRINFHPGLPKYPGRDVSHFACFNKEIFFGGTMHSISKKIDSGKIFDVKKFRMKKKSDHYDFTKFAHKAINFLLKKNWDKILKKKIYTSNLKWSKSRYTRKQFLKMMKLPNELSKGEFNKYFRSFYTYERKSLYYLKDKKKIYI
jgi:methionyl-tRNA formyltransferase